MRHPLDTTNDDAPFDEIIATGGFSDVSRWEYWQDQARLIEKEAKEKK